MRKEKPGITRTGFKRILFVIFSLPFFMFISCNGGGGENATVTISMKTLLSLQYDVVRFQVKPGTKVVLNLTNISDMSHNLLIAKPGARLEVVNTALKLAEKGPELEYIPKIDAVLWSIPIVSPGQTKSITFNAPSQPGVYPYVCTYPGHGFVMYGAMYVTTDDHMPDIKTDLNIPEIRRQDDSTTTKDNAGTAKSATDDAHPYALIPPYFYHVYLEGASPHAIAVHLPKDLSYAFDAGTCRMCFAWKGEFLNMSDLWKGHTDASAKVLGDIFYRDNTDYPFRLGENAVVPDVTYIGFRLINRYPEFHYKLNGVDVYELIRSKEDGIGLIREFRIPRADRTIWFFTNRRDDAMQYEFSAGKFADRKLKLSAAEAKAFTITMTSYYLAYKSMD